MPVLETERTILRPFTLNDAADVYAYCKDPRVGPIAGWKAHEGRSMEIGYALSPDYWGRGLMPEVVCELLRYGFRELNLDEIWATHYQENQQSRRVIEKSGFLYAFTEKLSDEFFPDRPTCFYFMTREMWEKRGH